MQINEKKFSDVARNNSGITLGYFVLFGVM